LNETAWGAALVRTASVGLTLLGLAAIGSTSFAHAGAPGLSSNNSVNAPANAMQANLLSVAGAAATTANLLMQTSANPTAPQATALAEGSAANGGASANNAGSGNATTDQPAAPSAPTSPSEPGLTTDGRIILNTATAAQLDKLPSVGMKRAEQIVALRERLGGRFKSLNDLLRIKGIGTKTLKKMLPMLVLDPPKDPAASEDIHSPPRTNP
jgi:competence protein ComEA